MEVYIPTLEELEKLQSLGINIYNYLIPKVTETIIMEDIIYDEGDMFEILDYLEYDPEIIYAICKMFPKKINESIITSKDPQLLKRLISEIRHSDKIIYKLDDYLMNFDKSILFDETVINSTINFIAGHISSCPKYRFDYQGPNELLDSIFGCKLPISKISTSSYDPLISIDPIYSVKLGIEPTTKRRRDGSNVPYLVRRGLAVYIHKYGLDESIGYKYQNKDIVNKPDEKVKKLIKCLDYHKQNYQL